MNDTKSSARKGVTWVKVAALLMLLSGLFSLGLVVAAVVKGQAFAAGDFLWVKPTRYLRFAFLGLAGAWLVLCWSRGTLKRAVMQLILLSFTGALCFVVAEVAIRMIMVKRMGTGSFEQFKEMKKRGEKIPVRSASPLAEIIMPSENPKLVYELQPVTNMMFGHKLLRISEQGFRADGLFAKERAPGSIRILGLGDSGMFGWGVDQGSNYMDVCGRALNARGDGLRYEMLNSGTPGYNTQLEVELLKDRGLAFQPDIVIVGWCENDFHMSHFFLKQAPLPKDHPLLYDLLFDREEYKKVLSGPAIGDRNNTTNKTGTLDLEQIPDHLESGTGEAGVRAALAELKALGAQHDFKILIFGPMKETVVRIAKELGLEFVNTLEKVDAKLYPEDYYVHQIHPRDGGHRVLGELIAKELDARGWLKPKQ